MTPIAPNAFLHAQLKPAATLFGIVNLSVTNMLILCYRDSCNVDISPGLSQRQKQKGQHQGSAGPRGSCRG